MAFFLLILFALSFVAAAIGSPEATGSLGWWELAVLLPSALGASWLATTKIDGRPMVALGLPVGRRALRAFGSGGLFGGLLTGGVTIGLVLAGWVGWTGAEGGAVAYAGAAVRLGGALALAAFSEELLFRGYPFLSLLEGPGAGVAIGATAIAFGLLHAANPAVGTLAIVNISLAGVLLGVAFWRTFDLWFVTGLHFGWNYAMGLADLPVSGLGMGMPGLDPVLSGPVAWTGGEFGPEGGVGVTVATLAGIAWLWRTKRLSRRLEVLALRATPGAGIPGEGSGG